MGKIYAAEDLPQGENVLLKKSFGSWTVVHPIKNSDGTINWFNLIIGGNWFNFWLTAVIVFVLCMFFLEYKTNLDLCIKIINSARPLV